LQKGPSALKAKQLDPNYVETQYAVEIAEVQSSLAFIAEADEALQNARNVMAARLADPTLEPVFINSDLVSGTGFLTAKDLSSAPTDPIFRLVFGPPKSKKGQFLLSVDGLYYDSQSGGLPTVSGIVLPEEKYKFEQDANLGGKGFGVSLKSINDYVDTIFDLNVIDNSADMMEQYDADHFYCILRNQKTKHIYDLSAQVGIAETYEGVAVVNNLRQSLYSTAAMYDSKINRRKKQIEVAIKAPYLFGKGAFFKKGEVPINDFSYLKDLNLAVAYENQKKLVLRQAEVSGVVLPLKPKFVTAPEAESVVTMNHLVVPSVGAGAIVYDPDSNGSQASILSLTDVIVKDGLFAIYNFLDGEVTTIGSDKYNVLNCASSNNYNNAQLIANTPSSVFSKGLAIPRFNGIATYSTATSINGIGSFAIMPDTREFQDWTYSPKGFTFESWVYTPGISRVVTGDINPTTGYGTSTMHRIILGCENTGGLNESLDPTQVGYSNNSTVTKGMLIGFTRDRQLTSSLAPNATNSSNPASGGIFYIAPTRSINASDIAFINKASINGCASGYEVLKCAIPISKQLASGKYVSSVNSEFMHFSVAVDPQLNQVRIAVDGELVATSALSDVFGVPPYTAPGIPSFKQSNSFEYSFSSTGSPFHINGPKLNDYFTPWILGGGYSDGNKNAGGFMNLDSGLRSGLNGHLGSVKFYSKALTTSETKTNFDGQKGFFKNIDL
jgi:hypothetical protein